MDADEQEALHEDFVTDVMMYISPEAKGDNEQSDPEKINRPGTSIKEGKDWAGKLLSGMCNKAAEKKQMPIRDKAEEQAWRKQVIGDQARQRKEYW